MTFISSELRVISVETIPGWSEDTVTPLPFSLLCRAIAVIICKSEWNNIELTELYLYAPVYV